MDRQTHITKILNHYWQTDFMKLLRNEIERKYIGKDWKIERKILLHDNIKWYWKSVVDKNALLLCTITHTYFYTHAEPYTHTYTPTKYTNSQSHMPGI